MFGHLGQNGWGTSPLKVPGVSAAAPALQLEPFFSAGLESSPTMKSPKLSLAAWLMPRPVQPWLPALPYAGGGAFSLFFVFPSSFPPSPLKVRVVRRTEKSRDLGLGLVGGDSLAFAQSHLRIAKNTSQPAKTKLFLTLGAYHPAFKVGRRRRCSCTTITALQFAHLV